jgi:hypothetical protein
MDWQRGLLRLWMVFSALWIIVIVSIDHENLSNLFDISKLRADITADEVFISKPKDGVLSISVENGRSFEFDTGGVNETMVAVWPVMIQAAVDRLNAQNAIVNNARQRLRDRAQKSLRVTLQMGLVPPLFILVIGWGLFWALRGFKGRSD